MSNIISDARPAAEPGAPSRAPAPDEAVRAVRCSLCGIAPGASCSPAGQHLRRWLDAYAARVISRADLIAVVTELTVVTKWCVVPPERAS